MTIQVMTASILTDGSGDFSVTMPCGGGFLSHVRYVVDGSSPLDTGADITLVDDITGVNLLNMDNIGTSSLTRYPRAFTANPADGAVSTTNVTPIAVHNKITFTVAQGGAANLGTFYVYTTE